MASNYTNLSKLADLTPIDLNFSNFTSGATAIQQVQETAQAVGNIWYFTGIILIFLFLVWIFYSRNNNFLLDMTRAMFISSGWCLLLSIVMLLSGWTTSVNPLFWFATIFILCIPAISKLQAKGL